MRVLIAGIGNIFLGDDGFGCEVARRLIQRELPAGVRVVDFGIRGFDLAYALMERNDAVILVDAVPRGEAPGTLYVIEPDLDQLEGSNVETHGMNPVKAISLAKEMGGGVQRILMVGCEPACFEGMGLSAMVEAAVEEAVRLIEELVGKLLNEKAHERSVGVEPKA
ncbi:MAG: hydrogenase maturation protease [Pyrinomonas sp.]|uniref:hydrogenase maturation protease n=1 Tax=Pyrinomonas sp. TaxID=2080306 RepID=UPI0033347897